MKKKKIKRFAHWLNMSLSMREFMRVSTAYKYMSVLRITKIVYNSKRVQQIQICNDKIIAKFVKLTQSPFRYPSGNGVLIFLL